MRVSLIAGTLCALLPSVLATESQAPLANAASAASSMVYDAMGSKPSDVSSEGVPFCIQPEDAVIVSQHFGWLISNYTQEMAIELLAEGFTDQSDSVNTLIHNSPLDDIPLGTFTFDTKQAFLDGQGAQPPVPFDILNTWNNCDTVMIRWVSHQEPDQVQGISIGRVQPAKEGEGGGVGVTGKYQINAIWAEFNSGAWLNNLGRPECR